MKKIYRFLIKIPVIKNIISYYVHYSSKERRTCYGKENPDKTFYIIGQKERMGGLWWIVNKVIMHLAYADEKGFIPIIDYKHFWTQYHNPGELNKVNVWEKFFMQPASYSLDDIKHSANIIISDKYPAPSSKYLMGNKEFYEDSARLEYFRKIFKKYVRFNSTTYELLEKKRKEIVPDDTKVLGVLCRGTDYIIRKPKNHPVQPEPSTVVEMSQKVMKEKECDYVFLATEDEDILNLFKKTFGSKLLYVNQRRVTKKQLDGQKYMVDVNKSVDGDKYQMGLDYLTSTYILSKCDCFIGGRTGGTKGVLLMRDKFEYEYIFDLGFYE